jgi:hypothetical protein
MYLAVKSVKPLDRYRLLVRFENEEERCFDVARRIWKLDSLQN